MPWLYATTKIVMMKNKLFSSILFISFVMIRMNANAQAYRIDQILDSIDANNPGLQQFDLKTESSIALGEASNAWMAPVAGLGMSEFPYGSSTNMNNGMMPRKMLMLRLQQMFPNFSKQEKEEKYHQSFARQNKDDRATMQNMLFAKAKMAYYDAFMAEKKLSIINEQEKQLQLLIQIAEERLAYNKAKLPDIYKARARLGDLQSNRIKLESKVRQSVVILNALMDRNVSGPLQIDTSENVLEKQMNILRIDSTYVLNHRSDILHITHEINSMRLKTDIESANAKPVFGITWDNMQMNGGHYMYNAMAMISIPVAPWFSKGYHAKVQSMDYQIQAMQKIQENKMQQALGNIHKDWLNYQSAQKDLQIFQEDVIPAYEKTYQSYMSAFSENTGDIYETLSAWNDLTQKKMEYYNKVADLLNIRVMLEAEMQGAR